VCEQAPTACPHLPLKNQLVVAPIGVAARAESHHIAKSVFECRFQGIGFSLDQVIETIHLDAAIVEKAQDYGDSAFNSRSVTTFHRLTSCIGKSAAHSA
jgi:hypothetical protein